MPVHELTRTEARRIAVRAQLLDDDRPDDLLDAVRRLSVVQIDATAAVAPSADLVLWSRLGAAYSRAQLTGALAERTLMELTGMIRPAEDLALYRGEMADFAAGNSLLGWQERQRQWVEDNDGCRRDFLALLDESGPLTAKELPDTCVRPWRSSGWNNNRNVPLMLEMLSLRGEVAVAGRRGADRLWDLAERIYPDVPAIPSDEALVLRNEKRLRALGIARGHGPDCPVEPWDVGDDTGEAAVIEGVKGEFRVDPEQLGRPFAGRAALLSPLDRLVHDRKRMVELFEFDYQLEMFKPAAKRRWGYYALPILYGDRLVGKVDATADRKAGVFRVRELHRDVEFSRTMAAKIDRELADLAFWLDLELQVAEP